jgi:hypothetical protein
MNASERAYDTQAPVYRRDLPGGGYVLIEVESGATASARSRIWVERRGETVRRSGHIPPIIAEADGDERSPEFGELYRIASDNAAIARALMHLPDPPVTRAD